MSWKKVGSWLRDNAGVGARLVGSLVTGNLPGAVAAGVSMISRATGTDDPDEALSILQSDPQAVVRLKEIAAQRATDIDKHVEEMARIAAEDAQKEHEQQQLTIRGGDTATDEYVRRTRPQQSRFSFYATCGYCFLFELLGAFDMGDGAVMEIAMVLIAPAAAYMGFRTLDKIRGRA